MGLLEQVKTKRTEVQTLVNQAKTLYADLEAQGDKATADDRQKLNNLIDAGATKRAELVKLEDLLAADEHVNGDPPASQAKERQQPEAKARGWGETVVHSEQFKAAAQRPTDGKLDRVKVPGGVKAVYGSLGTAGGVLVENDFRPEIIDIARQRPFSILDLVNVSPTNSDTVEYIEMDTRTNNAAVVPEFTAGNFGLKPESNVTFNSRTAAIKWIATWVAVSKQILSDAPRIRATIDGELTFMVRFRLEEQLLSGDGTGNNFTGMLNWPGIQIRKMSTDPLLVVGRAQTTGDSRMVTLRRAVTDIALEFYEANGIVMNPADLENLEVTEYGGNRYANAFDPVAMRVWRTRIITSMAIPALTALVGNFQMAATMYDREDIEILVGQPNDFFLRNAVALLAELRAGFAVHRPKAIEKVTMI